MFCLRNLIWAVLILAAMTCHDVRACTIVAIHRGSEVLVGNNEDWSDPDSKVWFQSPEVGKYGRVYFGFKNGWTQGGVNEKGLFFDWVAAFQEEPAMDGGKRKSAGNLCETILEKASTVEEAIQYYDRYVEPSFARSRILFADASGKSAIIGWSHRHLKVWRKETWYQVLSAEERARKAEEILRQSKDCSVEGLRALMRTCAQGGDYPTQYTNLCDLKRGVIYLYDSLRNQQLAVFRIQEEFQKGPHFYNIPQLSSQLKLPPLTDGKTWRPVNIDPSILTKYEGGFEDKSGVRLDISSEQGKLYGQMGDSEKVELLPASDRIFYLPYTDAQAAFLTNADGEVTHLVFLQIGHGDLILNKIPKR